MVKQIGPGFLCDSFCDGLENLELYLGIISITNVVI